MPHQPIRRLLHIIPRRPHGIIQLTPINTPTIIPPERLIIIPPPLHQLHQPIPIPRPLRPIPHHLQNTPLRIRGVELSAIMRLHDPRIPNPVVRRRDADIAAGFLDDDA